MSIVVTCDHAGCGNQADSPHWCSPEELERYVQLSVTLPTGWSTLDAEPDSLIFCAEHER